jgi:hypothetical protein
MKTTNQITLFVLTVCATTLLLSACNKKEEPAAPTTSEVQRPAEIAVTATNAVIQAVKETMVTNPAIESSTTDSQNQVQELIDKTKSLVAEKKYTEALSSLGDLSKMKLTPQQQTWMDEIKAQIQKAMASQAAPDATKTVSDAIPGLK